LGFDFFIKPQTLKSQTIQTVNFMIKKFTLSTLFLSLLFSIFFATNLQSQTGCPGCQVDVPIGMAEDTLYLDQ